MMPSFLNRSIQSSHSMFALISLAFAAVQVTQHEERSFVTWMRANDVMYTGDEYHIRFGIFLANLRRIQDFKGKSFKVGLNKFSTLTPAEYRSLQGFRMPAVMPEYKMAPSTAKRTNLESIDWREKGAVVPVKDQGWCGACWAFSACQAIESAHAITTGECTSLSDQNIIDCTSSYFGCLGGLTVTGIAYVQITQQGYMNLEKDYPYEGLFHGNCRYSGKTSILAMTELVDVPQDDEEAMAATCEQGCLSVAMDSSSWEFQQYTGGIFDSDTCSQESLSHAVNVVGFGKEGDTPYWIVRNSWGTGWGEQGYARCKRGKNICGISKLPLFVVLRSQ